MRSLKTFARNNAPAFFRTAGFAKGFLRGKHREHPWRDLANALHGKIFYSQAGEDKAVYEAFFEKPKVRNGFFVELGAFDGLNLSNTKFFEDYLGWKGLLIEPTPGEFEKLTHNRPRCILVNAAVSAAEGEVSFLGTGGTAGMIHTMSNASIQKEHADSGARPYMVPSMPFRNMLHRSGVKSIDFLSVDVQGAEFEVLSTFDWDIPTHIIAIELDGSNPSKDQKCRALLAQNGFKLAKTVDVSEIWEDPAYKKPATA